MRIAVFPGSFDPITLGHYDIIERASSLFDKIYIAIGVNSSKQYMFSLEQRKAFIEEALQSFSNVEVDTYEGLTVEYCRSKGARYILRGLRNPGDFEFEKAIAHANKNLHKEIETVFLLNSPGKSYISSSIVRDILSNGGDVSGMVPKSVIFKK